jgi:hypothetical protein
VTAGDSLRESNLNCAVLLLEGIKMRSAVLCLLVLATFPSWTRAQEAGPNQQAEEQPAAQTPPPASAANNADALRKAAQNPVASLISVPIQENWNFSVGQQDQTQNVLNIQPVIPVNLSQNWNLIIRWITPIVYQPYSTFVPDQVGPDLSGPAAQQPASGSGTVVPNGIYGFGDMQPAFFLAPKKGKLIWGIGPQFLLPTATKTGVLGQGKFAIGPTVVVLVQPGKWTLGALVNNVWSVAGHSDLPNVNQMLWQYFINYNLPKGWYLTWQPTITANWEASNGGRWVVPVGGGIGRIMKLGFQPANVGLQFYGNTVHPPGASPWGMRIQIAFLYPKKPKG